MKVQRVASSKEVLVSLTNKEIDAISRARREVKKSSIATDLGEAKTSSTVRNINALLMLVGRVFDDDRNSNREVFSAE